VDERDREDERPEDATGRLTGRRDAALEAMADRRDAAMEAMSDRRDRMVERRDAAMDAAAENFATARAAAGERVAEAREAAVEAIARVKPRMRGVSHELAEGPKATLATAIYAVSLSALFGVSALYHRIDWKRPEARRWMRRLDHTMIFFLIAGTVTPFAALVLEPPLATALLIAVWAGAAAGTIVELVWTDSPKWVSAIVYVAVGLIGAAGFPAIIIESGLMAGVLIAGGGALYATGAIVYAAQRPDPSPSVFGYHEIFHVLVIAAAAAHFAAVALYAVPAA
jgi:hemolysin III